MKRYFKATDGVVTIFRASATRVYQYGWFTRHSNEQRPTGASGFSTKPNGSAFPAIEISRAEYNTMVAIKTARLAGSRYAPNPQDSWVRNDEIERATEGSAEHQ